MTIGERIKNRRIELGLSQKELAAKMGYKTPSAICKVETVELNPTTDRVREFAKALDTTPEELMGWRSQTENNENSNYYSNPETAAIAQELFDNPDYRLLFDAAKDSKPEDIKMVADMLTRLKKTNPDG